MFSRLLAACLVDEDAAHGLGGGTEEVGTAVPFLTLISAKEPEVRLVHKSSSLEGLARLLEGQLLGGQFAQFLVDQRQ